MDLEKIDATIEDLRKQGKNLEALELVEECLNHRKQLHGPESDEVKKSYKLLCEMCNQLAIEYLQREDFHLALDLLKRAELLCGKDEVSRVKTLNNLACYYRQAGKARVALNYLNKALGIPRNLAVTHLNMCAVLSQIQKHDEALSHAMQAVIILQDELIGFFQNSNKNFEESAPMLAIAYHNMGVELEFLKRTLEAITIYRKAEKFSLENLPMDHPVTKNAVSALNAALDKLRKEKTRHASRKNLKTSKRDFKITAGLISQDDLKNLNKAWKSTSNKKKRLKSPVKKAESSSESEIETRNDKTELESLLKSESDHENSRELPSDSQNKVENPISSS